MKEGNLELSDNPASAKRASRIGVEVEIEPRCVQGSPGEVATALRFKDPCKFRSRWLFQRRRLVRDGADFCG